MWHVYILYSKRDGKLYVGCTGDLQRRLQQHRTGFVRATRHRRPLILVHSDKFYNKSTAFTRERFLKSLWGGRFKKKVLQDFLKKAESKWIARTSNHKIV